jgi:hypothetical protein
MKIKVSSQIFNIIFLNFIQNYFFINGSRAKLKIGSSYVQSAVACANDNFFSVTILLNSE